MCDWLAATNKGNIWACLIAVLVDALFNPGIAKPSFLPALCAILRMLPEKVLTMPPEFCFRYDTTHH